MMNAHMRFPGGKTKAVTLSYDDGVRQDLRLAALASEYGFKCTFNIISARVGDGGHVTYDELKGNILGAGHEVAVHGEYHLAPGTHRTLVGLRDALNCRLSLEQNLGVIIRGMAYPNSGVTRFTGGSDYETVKRYLTDLGIVYSRTLAGDNDRFLLPEDWHCWMPTAHHNNPHTLDWAKAFADTEVNGLYSDSRYPRLFYLWGHSYEFDGNDNWDRIEEFFRILGGKDDIWYATNIEIYDYVTAFRSLVFSADGTRVYNPTLIDLYYETEKKLYRIPSGQTTAIEA